jgi:hypothetical protein
VPSLAIVQIIVANWRHLFLEILHFLSTSLQLPDNYAAIVTIINLASTTIMCLALTFGSGGRKSCGKPYCSWYLITTLNLAYIFLIIAGFQAVLMGLNGFACLLPAAYWLHKIVFKDDYPFVRSISIFGLLTLIGLGK